LHVTRAKPKTENSSTDICDRTKNKAKPKAVLDLLATAATLSYMP